MLPTIHLIIAIATGLIVLFADEQALMWVLGKTELMKKKWVTFLHRAVTGGLTLLLLTGGLLYLRAPQAYLSLPVFITKMSIVLALILNTYFINRFSEVALTSSFASLSKKERLPLFISGAVSFCGWVGAFICGLIIA